MKDVQHSLKNFEKYCLNCEKVIGNEMKFCSYCGQKNSNGKVNVLTYFTDLFSLVFNIEGKLFTTLTDIFIPGKLTVKYFKGKRLGYFHPLRLFLVLAALLLAAISFSLKDNLDNIGLIESNNIKKFTTIEIAKKIDVFNQENCTLYDSLLYARIENFRYDILGDYENVSANLDDINIDFGGEEIHLKGYDIVKYNAEEIIEKNNIEGFWGQFFVKQGVKFFKNIDGFVTYIISNSLWLALLMMPFLAIILKIFYFKKYYIEHLVFSLHTHSFIFLILTLSLLLNYFLGTDVFLGLLFIAVTIYFLLSLKNYYRQSWRITLLKFFSIGCCYVCLTVFFVLAGLAFSAALF